MFTVQESGIRKVITSCTSNKMEEKLDDNVLVHCNFLF